MAIAPIGSIVAYAGKTAPKGWLLCDGSKIPGESAYKALIALVGANTPNLKGYFLRGIDGARELLSPQQDSVGPHTHTYSQAVHAGRGKSGGDPVDVFADYSTGNTGAPNPSDGETRPKNIGVNFIIKAIDEG